MLMFPRLRGCGRACQERGTRHSPGGFTLAEVLAAVLLLAIGLLAVIAAAQGARDSQQRAVYARQLRNRVGEPLSQRSRDQSVPGYGECHMA